MLMFLEIDSLSLEEDLFSSRALNLWNDFWQLKEINAFESNSQKIGSQK